MGVRRWPAVGVFNIHIYMGGRPVMPRHIKKLSKPTTTCATNQQRNRHNLQTHPQQINIETIMIHIHIRNKSATKASKPTTTCATNQQRNRHNPHPPLHFCSSFIPSLPCFSLRPSTLVANSLCVSSSLMHGFAHQDPVPVPGGHCGILEEK